MVPYLTQRSALNSQHFGAHIFSVALVKFGPIFERFAIDDASNFCQINAFDKRLGNTHAQCEQIGSRRSEQPAETAATRRADMGVEVPPRWSSLAVFRAEFQRTLAHLYPSYERAALR